LKEIWINSSKKVQHSIYYWVWLTLKSSDILIILGYAIYVLKFRVDNLSYAVETTGIDKQTKK